MNTRKGTIRGFHGSWGSGIATLVIEDSVTGALEHIPCENAQTVRSLRDAFGEVISPGHSVDPNGGHIGQEIYWMYDDMGLMLGGFMPVDDADFELIEAYENQEQEA